MLVPVEPGDPPSARPRTGGRRARRARKRRRGAVLLAVVAAGIACAVAAALAMAPSKPRATTVRPDPALALAQTIAPAVAANQKADGTFPNYFPAVPGGPRHDQNGTAMLGYSLLLNGLRTANRVTLDAGLRAVTKAARPLVAYGGIFTDLALTGAYLLAERRLAKDPGYLAVRPIWRTHLRHVKFTQLGVNTRAYFNWYLVEAVGTLQMTESGLRTHLAGSVLADPASSRRRALALIERELPAATRPYVRADGSGTQTGIVSDPPYNPLAYHAFSTGLVARAVELLGRHAPSSLRTVLRRAVAASWALSGPDGDVAYIGRSQEQSWSLALTAYAARVSAAQPGTSAAAAVRDRALSDRVLAGLAARYRGGPFGLFITPALREDLTGGVMGLDLYATAVSYTGITLLGLEWALGYPQTGADVDAKLQPPPASILSSDGSAFAVVRHGALWYVVKQATPPIVPGEPQWPYDLRYVAGLAALKARAADGTWHDVIPLRPRTRVRGDSIGPRLRSPSGTGSWQGTRIGFRGGRVDVSGGYLLKSGTMLASGRTLRIEPTACGLRLRLPARPGEVLTYSVFLRTAKLKGSPGVLTDTVQRVSFPAASRVHLTPNFHSDADPFLTRATIAFPPATGSGPVLTICDVGLAGAGG